MDRNGSDRLKRLKFLNRDDEQAQPSKRNHDDYWSIAHRYRDLPIFKKQIPEASNNERSRISIGNFNPAFELPYEPKKRKMRHKSPKPKKKSNV